MEKSIEQAAADAVKVITQAADAATARLVAAAEAATKVVANAASEAIKVEGGHSSNDHDLLIELRGKMDRLAEDIKELKSGHSAQITDHERRIGCLEKLQAQIDGVSGGRKDLWGWIIATIMTLIALASFIGPRLR